MTIRGAGVYGGNVDWAGTPEMAREDHVMTQLDRLEALAEKWKEPGKRWYGIATVNDALPDLIRVARAAKEVLENGGCESYSREEFAAWDRLGKAVDPLFSEVE